MRGQTTVEAAFVLPIALMLVLMLVQPGIILYDRIIMAQAAAEGCRLLATASDQDGSSGEDYVRRRLSAVPEMDLFHIHEPDCSWDIALSGDEGSDSVGVTIGTELKPVPLIGVSAGLLGLTNSDGNLEVSVSCESPVQPDWATAASSHLPPGSWIGAWS